MLPIDFNPFSDLKLIAVTLATEKTLSIDRDCLMVYTPTNLVCCPGDTYMVLLTQVSDGWQLQPFREINHL